MQSHDSKSFTLIKADAHDDFEDEVDPESF
jgi:hypothetical protein